MLKLIAAIGKNRELGKNGDLCFHIKADMRFFKETTMGHAVLMGYNTWLSLPKALPGRKNYVLCREDVELPAGVEQVKDLDTFLAAWPADQTLFIIGGASIYAQTISRCDELYLTEISATCEDADVFFPAFDQTAYRKEILNEGEENGVIFIFAKYTKCH